MNSRTTGLRVAGTIFGLMGLAQVVRLFARAEVFVAGHFIPLIVSDVIGVAAFALCIWLWKLSNCMDA